MKSRASAASEPARSERGDGAPSESARRGGRGGAAPRLIEDLIVALAADARPVSRLPPMGARVRRWLAATTAATVAGVGVIGARGDLPARIREAAFAGEAALMLSTGVLAAAAAFALSVPGAERTRYQRLLPLAAVVGWTGMVAGRLAREGASWAAVAAEPWHLACGAQILALSLLPAIGAFFMIRRAAPLQLGWTAFVASLAALAFAAVGVQLVCPIDPASHTVVSHAVPMAVLAAIGAVAGARWLANAGSG